MNAKERPIMSKPLLGILLGGILGALDGLSALVSAPELGSQIMDIVIGSTFKGLIAGVLIGWFARKVDSLAAGIIFGLTIGAALAFIIAWMQASSGAPYWIEIMLPGSFVGLIVGYATQKYGRRPVPA
jgi:hypothetical protein